MMASFKKVHLTDVSHVRIYYDQNMYAAHPNRGGIWNFGNGEIAVAHLLKPVDYSTGQGVHHGYSTISGSGVMLNRSFDGGQTWPQEQKKWIWHNDRSTEEIRSWLYDNPGDREAIDMSHPDAIMHFGITHYLRKTAGSEPDPINHNNTFCLRSKDRGRTWEPKPSMISPLSFLDGLYVANLGYIKFPNGVLGIAGGHCYYVSYDHGLTWDYVGTAAFDPRGIDQYTYTGVHRLPDERLMFSFMRRFLFLGDCPCVAFSEDGGLTWGKPKYIVRPDRVPAEALPKPGTVELPRERRHWFTEDGKPASNWFNSYRSPCSLVTRAGQIVVIFARRRPPYGIGGVVSDDLGQTWSQEFVLRADGCCGDCGYPVVTELDDGRIFTAYYIAVADSKENIPPLSPYDGPCGDGPNMGAWAAVREVDGTSFRIE